MIHSLHITNFQSHQESHLQFAPGLNVILGQTDSGKTSILRALYWLYSNRPSGEAFRSRWGGDTFVNLILAEEEMTRLRTNKSNSYCLGTDQEFKAMGKTVPEEIVKALNMTDLNWQQQLDPPFLLSESPGEVARRLNEIVNLGKIDSSLSNLSSSIRQNNQEVKREEQAVADQQEELKGYEYLDKMERDVARIEAKEEKWWGLQEEYEEIESLLTRMNELSAEIEAADKELVVEGQVNALVELDGQRAELDAEQGALSQHVRDMQKQENYILLVGENLDKYQKEFQRLMPDVCPLCNQEVK